ncbi:MAG: GNAT family N-acetyltransferase [Anaerolineae bacterium]
MTPNEPTPPVRCRLYAPRDAQQTAELVNTVFPEIEPLASGDWEQLEAADHSTVIADADGRVVGAIPFVLQPLLLRPDLAVPVAVAHCVCVHPDYRARGVGSALMRLAREALSDTCIALLVYTGGEGRPPYTFYERNGFVDLHYTREYRLAPKEPAALPPDILVEEVDSGSVPGDWLHPVFQARYGGYAGFAPRTPAHWSHALQSIIYRELPQRFFLVRAPKAGTIEGYVLLALDRRQPLAQILELAVCPGAEKLTPALLQAAIATTWDLGAARLSAITGYPDPLAPALSGVGFVAQERGEVVVAGQVINAQALWRLLGGEQAAAVQLWTPEMELCLPGPGQPVTLEMKRSQMQRLLLCREDLDVAIIQGRITGPAEPPPTLHNALRRGEWVYQHLDYL